MQFTLCFGAYQGKDVTYHLEKVRDHQLAGLEFYRWWNLDLSAVKKDIERIDKRIVSICARYISLVDETLRDSFIAGIRETIEAAKSLGATSIVTQTGDLLSGVTREKQMNTMVETLKVCAPLFEKAGLVLEIEPLNTLVNHPGYFLQHSDEAYRIVQEVDSPHVQICFDFYHQQVSEGNLISNARKYFDKINHFHIADHPGRTEPGLGEINYHNILKALVELDFTGLVGLECKFINDTDESIERFKKEYIERIFPLEEVTP